MRLVIMKRVFISLLMLLTVVGSYLAEGQDVVPANARSQNEAYYTVYVEKVEGKDWTERIQRALDMASRRGGTAEVVLPPGEIPITRTIDFSGMPVKLPPEPKIIPQRFSHRVVLRGPGGADSARLIWKGGPNRPVISITNSPWFARISDLGIHGNNVEGVIGIKYDADWDYTYWTSRLNTFQRLYIEKCDIGIDIGDNWGPDLTNLAVYDTWLRECRIGVRLTGANVACIYFYNIILSNYREAGIKAVAGRSMHINEVEKKLGIPKDKIPKKVLESRMTETGSIVCGGSPSYVVYNVNAVTRYKKAWLFEATGGAIRVYSVRHEGVGGVLKAGVHYAGRFSDTLVDVVSTAPGVDGIAIDYSRYGPLILVGGAYSGDIRINGENKPVFSLGVKFMKGTSNRQDLPGFIGYGRLHQTPMIYQRTYQVAKGEKSVRVAFDTLHRQPDADYQISCTPNWNSGNWWITNKNKAGFTLNFANKAGSGAEVDVTVIRRSWEHF